MGKLPKFMTILANVSGIFLMIGLIFDRVDDENMSSAHPFLYIIGNLFIYIPISINFVIWLRILRVNIQLKA